MNTLRVWFGRTNMDTRTALSPRELQEVPL
jgi:hypothetical protein